MYVDLLIECDECGRAFFGAGIELVLHRVGSSIICEDCSRKLKRTDEVSHRVASPASASARGTTRRRRRSARSVRRSPGQRRSDVRATRRRSSAHRRKRLSHLKATHPYKLERSWWQLHALLTDHLKRRGFSSAALIASRLLSEGIDGALSTVLLAFYLAVEDARLEWQR